jgi:hypothetical protein
MGKSAPTCEDCYFRKAGLCALVLERPCPTFRAYNKGALEPPKQASLLTQPLLLQPQAA